jgi:hypothetical protein
MNTPFSFSVLRYFHDVIGGEFVNIGIVVYAPSQEFLSCKISKRYARLSAAFHGFDFSSYHAYTRKLEERINRHRAEIETGWLFKEPKLDDLLRYYLPADASAYQFGPVHCGITANLEKEIERQFKRYVTQYVKSDVSESRDDDEVWTAFKKSVPDKNLLTKLRHKVVLAPDYEHLFEHAWKNERWHFAEPLSLDLMDAGSIIDKAHRWRGRLDSLSESSLDFKVHFVVGVPKTPLLRKSAEDAQNILRKLNKLVEIVLEDQTSELVREIEKDLAEASTT